MMVTLTVVILVMITLTSTFVLIFRHSLPISTDIRILMGINIKAHVYQPLYWDEYLVLVFILELAQVFTVTRMSVLALQLLVNIDTNLMSTSIYIEVYLKGNIGSSVSKLFESFSM